MSKNVDLSDCYGCFGWMMCSPFITVGRGRSSGRFSVVNVVHRTLCSEETNRQIKSYIMISELSHPLTIQYYL